MAQIYGELIKAQLQLATNLSTTVKGLIYFDEGDSRVSIYDGAAWQKLVTKASIDDLSALPIITSAKGGLGADASAWTGFVKASSGTFSAAEIATSDLPSGIDATKLADGSVDNLALQKLGTVGTDADGELVSTDSTQTLKNKTLDSSCSFDAGTLPLATPSKGGTGIANNDLATLERVGDHALTIETTDLSYVVFPTTGTLATLDGFEILLNKTVSSTDGLDGALELPSGPSDSRPEPPIARDGMIRFNTDLLAFEGRSAGNWLPIGGGGGTTDRVTQVGHGFEAGDVLYLNGSTYEKAKADAANTAEVVGVVSRDIDDDTFELTLSGEVTGLSGLVAGEVYFLSADTAGTLTVTEPSVVGQVSLPVGVASSTTSLYVAPKRGVVVGGTNARAQVSLTSGATTNVQDLSAYDAGELTGWVFLSRATPVRFFVSVKFAKSGPGGDYNMSYQTTGDNPPAGFSLQISTTGMLSATLPAASGTTSVINYALNAPAVGTSFPLTVNASQVQGRTSGTPSAGYIGESYRVGVSGSAPNLTTINLATISLPAGVWAVTFNGFYNVGDPVYHQNRASLSLTSATNDSNFQSETEGNSTTRHKWVSLHRVLNTSGQNLFLTWFQNGAAPTSISGYIVYTRIA